MKEQLRILNELRGKYISHIFLKRNSQIPFLNKEHEILTYDRIGLLIGDERSSVEFQYTIDSNYYKYDNHPNPCKLKINKESFFIPAEPSGEKPKEGYNSHFEIGFKIESIYVFEEENNLNTESNFQFINEVIMLETLGSLVIIGNENKKNSIWIHCYEMSGEQQIETSIKFKKGNIFENHNANKTNRKLIAKIDKLNILI